MKTAIILAQGVGSKLWPFGSTRPKTAVPIGGAPLLQQQVAILASAGIDRIDVVISSRFANQCKSLVAERGRPPIGAAGLMGLVPTASRKPIVEVITCDPFLGTAPALQQALQRSEEQEVLVLYGDVLLDPTSLPKLLAVHDEDRTVPLILAAPLYPLESPAPHLSVRVCNGQVEEMIAHARHSVTHRLAGAFVFRRDVLLPYLEAHPGYVSAVPSGGMPPQGDADLAQCVAMMAEDGLSIRAVEPAAFALDVDRPWDILVANHMWLGFLGRGLLEDCIHPTARVSEKAEVRGHLVLGENAVVGPGVIIEGNAWIERDSVVTDGAILGSNTHIGPRCQVRSYAWVGEHSSLGPRCKVSHTAEVNGVLFGRSTVMHYCNVWGVVGEATDIGAGTVFGTLRFDDQPQAQRVKGRWETPPFASDASFIGDFCRTGVNTMLLPGSKIGAYSAIGPGVIVSGDVPEHSLLLVKQELERREWGPEKYGW